MRAPSRKVMLGSLFGVVILASLSAILIQSGVFATSTNSNLARAERAAGVYAALDMAPLRTDEVRPLLEGASWTGAEGLSDAQRDGLLDHAAEFLELYFLMSPEDYIRHQRGHGHTPTDFDELQRVWLIRENYRAMTGLELPVVASFEELYALLRNATMAYGRGTNRAVAVAADSSGLGVSVRSMDSSDRSWPRLTHPVHADFWYGGRSMGARRWWQPLRDHEAALREETEIKVAVVGAVVEFADGTRRPLLMKFFWDCDLGTWQLAYVNNQNFLDTGVRPLDV